MPDFELQFFHDNGFIRKKCPLCNSYYWTQDRDQPNCGDAPCQEYTFLNKRFTDRAYSIDEMREAFLSFFERHDHTRLKRYPVAARWRSDIYLTIASIADFQPHVTSGQVRPPANPLVISQPCIRLNDLDSVGRTGRHLSEFEMMGHHAFNSRNERIYWKEETVEYCHEFLKTIGMSGESYKESTWVGGGNAGACLEVVRGGLEVATLVFMDLKEDPNGDIEVKGRQYSRNPLEIVDTGYGLERFVWASQERPTLYDALYPGQIAKVIAHSRGVKKVDEELLGTHALLVGLMDIDSVGLRGIRLRLVELLKERGYSLTLKEVEDLLVPMEKVYTIVDHSRALAFMLGDGIVPSNVKAGYLVRLVLRRTLRLMEDIEVDLTLVELVDLHIASLKANFPEILDRHELVMGILELETQRYRDTVERGRKLVLRLANELQRKGEKELPVDTLIDLYDTHGLHPTIVQNVTREAGLKLEIPDAFNALIAERHTPVTREEEVEKEYSYSDTVPLYYQDEMMNEFNGTVIGVEGKDIILNQTAFYPEGGGQPNDTGVLMCGERTYAVTDVQKYGGVIVHTLGGKPSFTIGDVVIGMVNMERRWAHMRHHTATHVVLEAARRVLGPHIWQTGSSFTHRQARYDITHYQRVTKEELKRIERIANEIVLQGHPVTKEFLDRDEAERRYGFRLYQGGAPKANVIRVVRVGSMEQMVDVEACGGTHVSNTLECGMIKILRCTSIQDGVERLDYTAGLASVDAVQEMEGILDEAADNLSVARKHLPGTVGRFFREWKDRGKEIRDLKEKMASAVVNSLMSQAEEVGDIKLVTGTLEMDMKGLQAAAGKLTRHEYTVAILGGEGGSTIVARSETGVDLDCGKFLAASAKELGGKGGGRPTLAQGKFQDVEKAVNGLKERVRKELGK
ncbi:MAG: alanine--tRNA ligase [Thermoplasmata archaeon]|nr:alanine--tRNA ligase [Thermoplasmata archaeon]